MRALLVAFCLWLPVSAPPAQARDLVVFAAASLKNAMDDVAGQWTATTGHEVAVAYAGSSSLARQIEQGAPADLFVSADLAWMDFLDERGLIDGASRVDLLGNAIVLVAHGAGASPVELGRGRDLVGLLEGGRLAMANVEAVPAGRYGKAALEHLGLFAALEPHLAQAENVRAALALVARGEAPFGIVYATDAVAEEGVTVVATFPAESHPPIVYPAAVTVESTHPAALAFLAHLVSADARPLFERQGFRLLD